MKKTKIDHYTDKEALDFHKDKKPGKIEIISSKNMTTKRDLALAYSPGVAAPVKKISENPEAAYDYTSKGNLVAVISKKTNSSAPTSAYFFPNSTGSPASIKFTKLTPLTVLPFLISKHGMILFVSIIICYLERSRKVFLKFLDSARNDI